MAEELSGAQRDRIVSLYRQGTKINTIAAEVGVGRASVYWTLHHQGVKPNRSSQRRAGEQITVAQALEQVAAANREIGRLEAALADANAAIARLRKRKTGSTR